MDLEFSGALWYWRGPAPWHFVTVPDEHVPDLADAAERLSYGWGCLPVTARIGGTTFTTSLFPKDGAYIVPVKADVRRKERLEVGDTVTVGLTV
jgi:Domain of unknown function (DUF1905)